MCEIEPLFYKVFFKISLHFLEIKLLYLGLCHSFFLLIIREPEFFSSISHSFSVESVGFACFFASSFYLDHE